MALPEHHLAKTIKDIYIFAIGLNGAINYLQEFAGDSELHPLFHQLLRDTNLFLDQHDQLKTLFTCGKYRLASLSGQQCSKPGRAG